MNALLGFDKFAAAAERSTAGLLSPNVYLLLGRLIFGLPLVMNGVGQMAMPELIEGQMEMYGVSLAWKWPAIMASLLGGLAIVLGWRVRLAAVLLIVYVVAATLMFHNTQTMVSGDDPLEVPELAVKQCEWYIHDYKGIESVSDDFLHGCALYRLWFDGTKTMDHLTMMVPALLLLAATGGGRFSLEHWLRSKREV